MTQEHRGQLIESLKDKELRDYYVADHISEGLAFQIRAMREARGWTQRELGERAGGMAQERVSQLEDPNYGRLALSTLKRIASAFDVALVVRFAPYSELVDWTLNVSPDQMAVPCFDEDRGLEPSLSSLVALQRATSPKRWLTTDIAVVSTSTGSTYLHLAQVASAVELAEADTATYLPVEEPDNIVDLARRREERAQIAAYSIEAGEYLYGGYNLG